MGTDDRPREAPRRATPGGAPPEMTEAEKRRAEWEARHDVAARGHHAAPDVVQHYVAHERLTHPSAPLTPVPHAPAGPGTPAAGQPQARPAEEGRQPRRPGFLRRLFSRGRAGERP